MADLAVPDLRADPDPSLPAVRIVQVNGKPDLSATQEKQDQVASSIVEPPGNNHGGPLAWFQRVRPDSSAGFIVLDTR